MVSEEEVRWKLAICEACGQRRMMPEANTSCPGCERERHAATLSAEDIRWVIAYRGPERFVRGAWRLATPSTNAAMGLDLRTGRVTAHRWDAGEEIPAQETEDVIVLAVCPASRRAEVAGLLAAGAEGLFPEDDAEDLACEVVARSALGDGGRRFWEGVDAQLRKITGLRQRS